MEGQGRGSLSGGGPPAGVSYTLCQGSSIVSRAHPHAFVCPHVHQGGGSEGGQSCPHRQGCSGACSFAFSRLLQPSVCGVEDLGVLASCHRPLSSLPFSHFFSFQDGDHPVRPSVGSSGGLDVFHRPEGGLLAGPCSSRLSQVSMVCGFWPSVSINSALFASVSPRPLRSSHGLWLRFRRSCTPWVSVYVAIWTTGWSSLLLERLFLASSGWSSICVGSWGSWSIPRSPTSFHHRGFCIWGRSWTPGLLWLLHPGSDRQAAVSRRLISVLCSAANLLLAVSSRHPVLSVPSCSRGLASRAVPAVSAAPVLGLPGRLCSRCLDSRLSPRPPLVVRRVSSVSGGSLAQLFPDLDFWSDASDVGWGVHLGPDVVSGLWSPEEACVSINTRELLAVEKGLLRFQASLVGPTVAVFVDNSTAVAYLRKLGGTRSLLLNKLAQDSPVVRASLCHSSPSIHSGLLQ